MTNSTHKLSIRIGDAVFEAEGSEEAVREQFEAFRELVSNMPPSAAGSTSGGNKAKTDEPESHQKAGVDELRRIFTEDRGDSLSLRVLPQGKDARLDTLLLLLWGYKEIKDADSVNAGKLIASARQSGLKLDRIDRVLISATEYVRSGGAKRGKRYSLTNPGINHAEKLADQLLD